MIFLFFCICLIFSVAFHPPLMQSRAQPHLPAGNCHCAPSHSLPFLLSALPFPPLCFIHFCSVSVSVHLASSSARLLRFFLFFLCCFPSIFPFFVCCAAVTFGHNDYHLPTIPLPLLPIIIIIFGCCGRRCCNRSARSVRAIFIVLCTHNFILAHFWVVYFYGYI